MDSTAANTTALCPSELGLRGIFELTKSDRNLSIIELVTVCPETCKLVLGLGNPDISGIGVRCPGSHIRLVLTSWFTQATIAYFIQIGASMVFGPFLYLVLLFWPWPTQKRLWLLYQEVLETLLKQNAAFTLPVGIAACIAISQYPTAFEVEFLSGVVVAQSYCLIGIAIPYFAVSAKLKGDKRSSHETPHMHTGWKSILHLGFKKHNCLFCRSDGVIPTALFFAGCFILPSICFSIPSLDRAYKDLLTELTLACNVLEEVFGKPNPHYSLALFISMWVKQTVTLVLIVFTLRKRLFERWRKQEGRQEKLWRKGLGICAGGYATCSLYWLLRSQQKRQKAIAHMGGESSDDLWGFGQIVALFLWVPLLLKILVRLYTSSFVQGYVVLTPLEKMQEVGFRLINPKASVEGVEISKDGGDSLPLSTLQRAITA